MSFHKQLYKAYLDDLNSDSFEEYLVSKLETVTALLSIQGETLERYEVVLIAIQQACQKLGTKTELSKSLEALVTEALKEAE